MHREHMRRGQLLLAALLALLVGASACGDEGGSGSGAPTINNFSFSPTVLPAGQQTLITGAVNMNDPEGDVNEFTVAIGAPDGSSVSLSGPIDNPTAVTMGVLNVAVTVTPSVAGIYTIDLSLGDADGNVSNTLSDTFTVN